MAERNDTNPSGGRGNPARNLTHEDRVRGGSRSAQVQVRDALGQFAGKRAGSPGRADDSRGRNRGGQDQGWRGEDGGQRR
jgi:hypothetical protein